ncbi:protein of unknown function [Georgfuchsia toluolica]|uniref:Transposase n=1 Tax=Georgfuchsia toluolica TaxID=424218 RepID=A0A916J438_9PROT|nr:hypothetical protein [Georgfuchsia toluolica]CAG4884329.1 protein of unknown function [Georgfuchsia toluolica]
MQAFYTGQTKYCCNATICLLSYAIRSLRTAALRGGVAWAFVEAAHFALRFCPEAKRFYERKKAKTNSIIAIKALAHKLARACYHMLKENKPFNVHRCFA